VPVPVRRVLPWRASAWASRHAAGRGSQTSCHFGRYIHRPAHLNNNAIDIDTANDGRDVTQDLSNATIRTGSRGIENSRLLLNSNKTRRVDYALDLISPNYDRIAPS
jgi:hypothetical protein